jgi:cephalosporin hydroxylase
MIHAMIRIEVGPGPLETVQAFLPRHPEFIVDTSREKYGMSFNRGGYLKRTRWLG